MTFYGYGIMYGLRYERLDQHQTNQQYGLFGLSTQGGGIHLFNPEIGKSPEELGKGIARFLRMEHENLLEVPTNHNVSFERGGIFPEIAQMTGGSSFRFHDLKPKEKERVIRSVIDCLNPK